VRRIKLFHARKQEEYQSNIIESNRQREKECYQAKEKKKGKNTVK
jgi:hypothetical protein